MVLQAGSSIKRVSLLMIIEHISVRIVIILKLNKTPINFPLDYLSFLMQIILIEKILKPLNQ
jgi:hypothetical protein